LFFPPLSFFLSTSTYIFTAPTCTTTIIRLQPWKLNAEFQHFIPRFNKISLQWGPHSKERMGGERRPKNRVSLRRTLFWPPLGSKLSKYGNPRKTNSLKSGNFGTFSLNKNPCWYESHLIFFLSPSGHNSPPKEKRKMVGLLWIYLINYNVFVKLEKNGAIIW